jgi:Fe2+ or Zn2+ uptake regulation protein
MIDKEKVLHEIEEVLKSEGLKSTFSRREILATIINSDRHLRPEDIFERVKELGISLPTVYRNIELLRVKDIISEISVEGNRYFELKLFSKKRTHMHFYCTVCKELSEITDSYIIASFVQLNMEIERKTHFRISNSEVVLHGECERCVLNGKTDQA